MLECGLQRAGECTCTTKCAKLKWYEKGRADAFECFLDKILQHSTYTENEEGWSGFTVETKIIEKIYEELKR